MADPFVLGSGMANYVDAVKTDFGDTSDIGDVAIRDIVVKSIRRVNWRLKTSFQYFPTSSGISPIPSETLGDLIILQAECFLAKRRRFFAIKRGIDVRSGDQAIDTTAGFGGHSDVTRDICGEVENMYTQLKAGTEGPGKHGKLIWYGNQEICIDHDHDGQSDATRSYESPFDNIGDC